MKRERLYRAEAIILKRSNLGEADRLLTLYTPHMGKRRVTAKGIRKLTSRKAGHLELFTHSQLLLARGRSLDIITQAETINSFPKLRTDLSRTSHVYYISELLDRFTREGIDNHPLFELLLQTLGWLDDGFNISLTARFYELHLLGLVGYQPQLFHCVRCNETIKPTTNYFSAGDGGVVCPHCAQASPDPMQPTAVNSLKVLRYLQTHSIEDCYRLQLNAEIQKDLERIMQRYITYYLERNLKSVEFIHLIRQPVKPFAYTPPAKTPPAKEELQST